MCKRVLNLKTKYLRNLKESNLFKSLKASGIISEKELQYFTYNYKKTTNLGQMYLLPKIHKSFVGQ